MSSLTSPWTRANVLKVTTTLSPRPCLTVIYLIPAPLFYPCPTLPLSYLTLYYLSSSIIPHIPLCQVWVALLESQSVPVRVVNRVAELALDRLHDKVNPPHQILFEK